MPKAYSHAKDPVVDVATDPPISSTESEASFVTATLLPDIRTSPLPLLLFGPST
ncbi:uncharacterized protein MYCGRDRAFT_83270, partial [Zymoseptoria tritici IPO323]